MPDYYPLMAGAVSKLDRNTGEARQALFECARVILVEQLRARQPPATEPEIMHERFALEDAILKVESELATDQVSPMGSAGAATKAPCKSGPRERIFEQRPIGDGQPRGRLTLSEGRRTLELFKPADASTTMHLMGHLWFDEMVCDAARPDGPQSIKSDLQTVLAWLGVKKPEDIGTEQHQQWARGFEQYLMEGRAPSASLASTFKDFRAQLLAIYRNPSALGTPITDEIREVFDRMLATDEDIAKYRAVKSDPPTVRGAIQPTVNANGFITIPGPIADRVSEPGAARLVAKGLLGFVAGFILVLGLELLLFGGAEFLTGHRLHPVGAGWIVMPILAGCGGWKLFREINFAAAIGVSRFSAELRKWPREHKIALAIAIAIGWIVGALLGFFVSIAGRPDYYPPTLETWFFGRWHRSYQGDVSVQYFPWASLAWGLQGELWVLQSSMRGNFSDLKQRSWGIKSGRSDGRNTTDWRVTSWLQLSPRPASLEQIDKPVLLPTRPSARRSQAVAQAREELRSASPISCCGGDRECGGLPFRLFRFAVRARTC